MTIVFEKYYITRTMLQYEWNIGVWRGFLWPGRSKTDSGWSLHVGPFWFRKWR